MNATVFDLCVVYIRSVWSRYDHPNRSNRPKVFDALSMVTYRTLGRGTARYCAAAKRLRFPCAG